MDIPGWQLRTLAELIGEIGPRKFPDAFLGGSERDDSQRGTETSARVSAKALRLLAAVAEEDLTLNEAADKMCISIHTANQHMALARRALGAATTPGAIYVAMQRGLIEV